MAISCSAETCPRVLHLRGSGALFILARQEQSHASAAVPEHGGCNSCTLARICLAAFYAAEASHVVSY